MSCLPRFYHCFSLRSFPSPLRISPTNFIAPPYLRSRSSPRQLSPALMTFVATSRLLHLNSTAVASLENSSGGPNGSPVPSSSSPSDNYQAENGDEDILFGYHLPPKEIRDIVDAPPLPVLSFSPHRDKILFLKRRSLPPLSELAKPEEKLAGIRIDGNSNARSRMSFYTGIGIHSLLNDGTLGPEKEVQGFPDGSKINFVSWMCLGMTILGFASILGPLVLWAAYCLSVWALTALGLGFGCTGCELKSWDLLGMWCGDCLFPFLCPLSFFPYAVPVTCCWVLVPVPCVGFLGSSLLLFRGFSFPVSVLAFQDLFCVKLLVFLFPLSDWFGWRLKLAVWLPFLSYKYDVSKDGCHLAFSIRTDEEDNNCSKLRVWVADVDSGKARPLFHFVWVDDSTLLVCTIPISRGSPPKKPLVPSSPKIQSNEKQNIVQVRTFQDLLKDEYDKDLFDYYAVTQLVLASLDGTMKPIGPPAVYTSIYPSPDGKYLLVYFIHRPYSFIVHCGRFPTKVDLWSADGEFIKEICDLPLAEDIPIAFNSVRKGKRSINWRPDKPSTLYW
ncbi:putative glutamyl endopeptidase, chloroplastic [Dendrobium catenatum]|uniref:Putative glutamyl endopeptidase, chloroplastic n=1 Tax=Dendrobium catenatum TaxID=906689 RepID=A0A2I0WB09_9ASPA|nr:putative glutamyl endopeptidase, chloroplastic [Dendrobium catenatum]